MQKYDIGSKYISKLDLSNRDLKEIPKEVFELKNLKRLNLSNNRISIVPKKIEKLQALRTLDLSGNHIKNFYAKICTLKNLRRLNLNKNQIRTIPKQISFLSNLRTLSIGGNKLEGLPEEMKSLTELKKLNISKNPFDGGFPYVLFEMDALEHIWFNGIPFKRFPTSFLLRENLKSVYFYYNLGETNGIGSGYLELSKIKGNLLKSKNQDWKWKAFNEESNLKAIEGVIDQKQQEDRMTENKGTKTTKQNKTDVFISYSHKDVRWLEEIKEHLTVLSYQGVDLDVWDDRRIISGEKWQEEIEKSLESAKIAILILSTSFLASDFIQNNELPELLKNAEKKGTVIIPVIARPCRFREDKRLNVFQAVNNPSEPLNKVSEPRRDEILLKLTHDIEGYIKNS